jgi:hypothetical protein
MTLEFFLLVKVITLSPSMVSLHLVESICCWVRGLVCSNELESYAGSSIDAGRATQTKRDTLVLQVGGLVWG